MISLPVLAASSPTLISLTGKIVLKIKNHVKTFVRLDLKIIGEKCVLIAAPPRGEMALPILDLFRTGSLVPIPNLVSIQ